jgi:hypothetical protein
MTPTNDNSELTRIPPNWHELYHLIEGARRLKGWTDEHSQYLVSSLGITWAKAYVAGREGRPQRVVPFVNMPALP